MLFNEYLETICFSALLHGEDSDDESILAGRRITALSNAEEEAHGLGLEVGWRASI
jgi:hypothetical protein